MSTIPRGSVGTASGKPETGIIGCGDLKLSKRGVWRAAVLTLIQLAIVIHILQWKATGRTLTPVEPSEAMKTLEQGYLNAGFILFTILILSTMVFGRFFCGWGCHVVAYQDLCGWLMKKIGMKPKPFRSRLLIWVPTFAAFYMFLWPQVLRIWAGGKFPPITYHLTTEGFWDTFPGFWIGLLTFAVCGFLIVYLLGNKGFCSYGCPYGAIFAKSDRIAPGRIMVTDACEQCGHCTATCTSNVRVHEEVKNYGMVMDVGCMKCMDCISVCPKDALYFGFTKPAFLKKFGDSPVKARSHTEGAIAPAPKKYDFSWPEEIAMALVFVIGFYAFRGLYEGIPFLLSVGLSSVCAFVLVQILRLFYASQVRVQKLQLRIGGKTTGAGWAAVGFGVLLALFIAHSAIWQYKWHEGNRLYIEATELAQNPTMESAAISAAKNAQDNLEWCHANGLFAVADLEAKLGTSYEFTGHKEKALPFLKRAIELNPKLGNVRYQLAKSLALSGNPDEALAQLKETVRLDPAIPGAQRDLASALASAGQTQDALLMYGDVLKREPSDVDSRLAYGLLLAQSGKNSEGEAELLRVVKEKPEAAIAHYNLALIFAEKGRKQDAAFELRAAIKREPQFALAYFALGRLSAEANKYDEAKSNFMKTFALEPYNAELISEWAEIMRRQGMLILALKDDIRKPSQDIAAWYRACFLYKVSGHANAANSIFRRLKLRNPNLPRP